MIVEIDLFMDYLSVERNMSANTIDAYSRDLMQFLSFMLSEQAASDLYGIEVATDGHDVQVDSITKDTIRAFVEYRYDGGLKKASIRRTIATLKSFFKFLYNRDMVSRNPASSIVFPRGERKLPRFLTGKQVNALLDFPLVKFIDYRDRALLEVFYSSGARVSELVSAKYRDCDLKKSALRVKGKGSIERFVFLTPASVDAVNEYLEQRIKKFHAISEPLFINDRGGGITQRGIFYAIEKRAIQAGFPGKVTPHMLRHSFATEMMNQGADLRAVQEMLGHQSLSTTQVYTHTTKNRLRDVYDRFHPHSGSEKGTGE